MKQAFKGKLLKVFIQKERLPNGYLARLEVVRHPGAALVVPLLNKDKIIILHQYRPVIKTYLYELPAGTLERKESPLACARREIIEETGYAAGKLTLLGKIFPVPGYSTEKINIYKAEVLEKIERAPEEDEVIKVCIFTRAEIKRSFKNGKITDAKTIAALALAGWL